jgi:hypothetical protein
MNFFFGYIFVWFFFCLSAPSFGTLVADHSMCQYTTNRRLVYTHGAWLYTLKQVIIFGMSLTKLSLAGNNLKIPGQGEFG